MTFPVAQMVKSLPVIQETWAGPLAQEDPLEKGMAILQYSGLENSVDRADNSWDHTELSKTGD